MAQPNDPYKTRPLPPLTQTLAQPVSLPLAAVAALAVIPAVILAILILVWVATRPPTAQTIILHATPTLGLPRKVARPATLPRAAVAYAAPAGTVVGALEPGRPYTLVARSGLEWVQLDVALPGESDNLVWVATSDVPELSSLAGLVDLALPQVTATAQVVYVPVPAPPAPAGPEEQAAGVNELTPLAPSPLTPSPTVTYLLPPATPAPRSVVVVPFPTAEPCSIRELGVVLRPCNGIVP